MAFFLVSALIGVFGAMWWGLNPLSPWLAEMGLHGAILILGFLVFQITRLLGLRGFAIIVLLLMPVLMTYTQKYLSFVQPSNSWYDAAGSAPVGLSTQLTRDGVVVQATHNGKDWLGHLQVRCQLYFENGAPRNTVTLGMRPEGWLARGESFTRMAVRITEVPAEVDLGRTKCSTDYARYFVKPNINMQFTYSMNPQGYYMFRVNNSTNKPFTGIGFSCTRTDGSKIDPAVAPAYKSGMEYVANPGEEVVLRTLSTYWTREFSDCQIKDIKWR